MVEVQLYYYHNQCTTHLFILTWCWSSDDHYLYVTIRWDCSLAAIRLTVWSGTLARTLWDMSLYILQSAVFRMPAGAGSYCQSNRSQGTVSSVLHPIMFRRTLFPVCSPRPTVSVAGKALHGKNQEELCSSLALSSVPGSLLKNGGGESLVTFAGKSCWLPACHHLCEATFKIDGREWLLME